MINDSKSLTNLLHYLNDSVNGLKECIELVTSLDLKNQLKKLVTERTTYVRDIENVITSTSNSSTVESGTIFGPLHRFYIDLKVKLSSNNSLALKEEILRGDKILIDHYNETIKEQSGEEIKNLLSKHLHEIHLSLKDLTNSVTAN